MKQKIPVGLLGATGTVGQRFVELLSDHPWFDLTGVAASERSEGKAYADAVRWRLAKPLPGRIGEMKLLAAGADLSCRIVFSALDSETALKIEPEYARRGAFVFSNASAFRMEPDVPLVVPEINADAVGLLPMQQRGRGWKGAIVTNPNCSTTFLAMALAPLQREFGIEKVFVTTLQAVSGAGYPGVPSLDILGNVLPDIPEEAAKIERETLRILGRIGGNAVEPASFSISAMTYRVPVEDGHTESVFVGLSRKAAAEEIERAWDEYRGPEDVQRLPSAPVRPIVGIRGPHRPQPRRDALVEDGMATLVGGLKPCGVLDWKFTALGHNTIRGAAGGSVLNAEYAAARGLLD
jgi:aspartate-semialdehyde dehydrogenase